MKIAMLYDTFDTYEMEANEYICDFNEVESMESIKDALIELGHEVDEFTKIQDILTIDFSEYDLVFNVFEGKQSRNREALVTGLLELKDIPFIGADSYIAIVSLDKILSKIIARHLGLKVPKYLEYSKLQDLKQEIEKLKLPVIVKPCFEGNSAGIRKFDNYEDAKEFIGHLLKKYNNRIICEEFIKGQELTVPIIGNGESAYCLGVAGYVEQSTPDFWLDYKYKLFGGFTDCVADIDKDLKDSICNQALKFYKYVNCIDYGRIDFRLGQDNNVYFLELNAYPTLSTHGSFVVLGECQGYTYTDIIEQIISAAKKRLYRDHSKTR